MSKSEFRLIVLVMSSDGDTTNEVALLQPLSMSADLAENIAEHIHGHIWGCVFCCLQICYCQEYETVN